MNHFLLKTEPSAYSIDDLKRDGKTSWGGVRNYQARNIIRDLLKQGDECLIYHSSCEIPAAVGVGKVVGTSYPDPLQFDEHSEYFDPKATVSKPTWFCVDIAYKTTLATPVTLQQMRTEPQLAGMRLLLPGNRLSVFPVQKQHFETIMKISQMEI